MHHDCNDCASRECLIPIILCLSYIIGLEIVCNNKKQMLSITPSNIFLIYDLSYYYVFCIIFDIFR